MLTDMTNKAMLRVRMQVWRAPSGRVWLGGRNLRRKRTR
jgi:hypothetical protein